MLKDTPSRPPGQPHSDRQPETSRPNNTAIPFKPNCDIFSIRAIFDALEKDFAALLERKFRRLRALDTLLGSQALFDDKTGKAARIHRKREALKEEMDVLFAMRDYLKNLTGFALESWAALSDAYTAERLKLEQEIENLRTKYLDALHDQSDILAMWNSDLKRQNASRL